MDLWRRSCKRDQIYQSARHTKSVTLVLFGSSAECLLCAGDLSKSSLCVNPNSLVKLIIVAPILQKRKPRHRVVSSKSRVTGASKMWSQDPSPGGAPRLRSGRLVALSLRWGARWQGPEVGSRSNCSSCGQEAKEERRREGEEKGEDDEIEGGRENRQNTNL